MNKIKKTQLKSWLISNKIESVISDLDDTLIETSEIFDNQKRKFVKLLKRNLPNIKANYISKKVKEIDIKAFEKYGSKRVKRWNMLIFCVCRFFKLNYLFIIKNSWNIFKDIYISKPNIRKGAIYFLNTINSADIPIYLLTNSNRKWTRFKINKTGLSIFFEKVYAVSKKHKTIKDWRLIIDNNKLNINKILAIGDSYKNDIEPAISIGINKIIWIKEKNDLDDEIKIIKSKELKYLFKHNQQG